MVKAGFPDRELQPCIISPFLTAHRRTKCHQAETKYSGNGGLWFFNILFNLTLEFAVRITEKVVQCTRIIIWNTEKNTSTSICQIGVLETFLNHDMVFLGNSGADKSLCIVAQLLPLFHRYFIISDDFLPQVHWFESCAESFHRKLVRWLVFNVLDYVCSTAGLHPLR